MWQLELVIEVFVWANILANLTFVIGFRPMFTDILSAYNGSPRRCDDRVLGAHHDILSRGAPGFFAAIAVAWAAVMILLPTVLSDIPLWGSGILSVFLHVLVWLPLGPVLLIIASLVVRRTVVRESAGSAG